MTLEIATLPTQTPVALSTDPHGLRALDARRRTMGVALTKFLGSAGVDTRTWWRLLAGAKPQPRTLIKLSRALDRLATGGPTSPPPALVAAFWRAAVTFLCAELKADVAIALAREDGSSRPMDAGWLRAARARQLAYYLTHVELQVTLTELARACSTSKQRVHKAVNAVEDLRDDPAIDALLSRAAAIITGGSFA